MKKTTRSLLLLGAMATGLAAETQPLRPVYTVPGELNMLVKHGHIQGATCSEKAIYVSQAGGIAKVDWQTGHVVKTCDARPHRGDTAQATGRTRGE